MKKPSAVNGAGSVAGCAAGQEDAAQDGAGRVTELGTRVSELEAQAAGLNDEVAAAAEKIAALSGEKDAWQSKATTIYDHYLRTTADFDSYRKRTERDAEDKITRGKTGFLRAVLEVMDNFERFLQATEKAGKEGGERSFDAFLKGVAMVRGQLMDTLLKEGVEPMGDPVGKQMDPTYHDAVTTQEGGGEHGTIAEELQKGYVYKGLVLRPAKVKVIS